ncbi:hypothetical protein CC79DRAFT_824768 [Sarocladium strictum]
MSIKQLPPDAVEKIKSTVTITSLHEVVSNLIKNSLDASATKIHVTFDYSRGSCSVEDNGRGIPPPEFEPDGGLGKLQHTSKYPRDSSIHGFRGNFLASLASLSVLKISSQHTDHQAPSTILFHNGNVLSRSKLSSDEERKAFFEHGTHVIVRDLFGNLPVRVKQRAINSIDAAAQNRIWTEITRTVIALLLAWPLEIRVLLRDTQTGRELRLQAPQTTDITRRTAALLKQGGLVSSEEDCSLVHVSSETRRLSISGCFSTDPVPSRRSQFLSLGIQPLENTSGYNVLFEEINKIFKSSNFGIQKPPTSVAGQNHKLKDEQPRRGSDKNPMFYLKIDVSGFQDGSRPDDTLFLGEGRMLETILDVLRALAYGFLKSHYFNPQKLARISADPPSTTARKLARHKRPQETRSTPVATLASSTQDTSRTPSPFDGWNRVKSGVASRMGQKSYESPVINKERLIGTDGSVLRRPFNELPAEEAQTQGPLAEGVPAQKQFPRDKTQERHVGRTRSRITGSAKQSRALMTPNCDWLAKVVQGWENPIFENTERSIPLSYSGAPSMPGEDSYHWAANASEDITCNSASIGVKRRLSKEALLDARVINQVDNKFILVKLSLQGGSQRSTPTGNAGNVLVMLDQHAVDERCQLEDLLAEYFTRDEEGSYIANTEPLEKPLFIDMTGQEINLLQQCRQYLQDWGIICSVRGHNPSGHGNGPRETLSVGSLPPSIAERCRTEPRLLIDILRYEAWRFHDTGTLPSRPCGSTGSRTAHPWVGLFRDCPRGILDLLHSRSCRSAIMFNDILSKTECTSLIERLSRCAFPFQCAHGRPSMAPVLDMGTEPLPHAWTGEEPVDVRKERWKKWMES